MAVWFNALIEHLRQVYISLAQAVELLEVNLGTLKHQLQEQAAGTARQAASLHQTQVTAEEIRQTCYAADTRARSVLEASSAAANAGREGGDALARGRDRLGAIIGQVADMRSRVGTLPPQVRQIEAVLDTVKDLADQSNLLALNAAIEAMRSGEHGKGFALVAREIRVLADQSVQSTERIRATLDSVQKAVAEADRLAGEGAHKVREGLEQVSMTSAALERLASLVQSDADAARQIAEAVRQQTEGVNQIFLALGDQNRLMDENRRQALTASEAMEPLEKLTVRIAKLVRRFSVN
jgi:methyl-accepting chemotaxis protein